MTEYKYRLVEPVPAKYRYVTWPGVVAVLEIIAPARKRWWHRKQRFDVVWYNLLDKTDIFEFHQIAIRSIARLNKNSKRDDLVDKTIDRIGSQVYTLVNVPPEQIG